MVALAPYSLQRPATVLNVAACLAGYHARAAYPQIPTSNERWTLAWENLRGLDNARLTAFGMWMVHPEQNLPHPNMDHFTNDELVAVRDFPGAFQQEYALVIQELLRDEITAAFQRGDYPAMLAASLRNTEFASVGLETIVHLLLGAQGIDAELIETLLLQAWR